MKVQGTLKQINEVWVSEDKKDVLVYIDDLSLAVENKDIQIKLNDTKVKVSMFDFLFAVKDMLDTGVFELDQIDSKFWELDNALVETRNQRDNYYEKIREMRGF